MNIYVIPSFYVRIIFLEAQVLIFVNRKALFKEKVFFQIKNTYMVYPIFQLHCNSLSTGNMGYNVDKIIAPIQMI